MLLGWGIEQCQKLGVPAYVESTIEAGHFYKKHGFSPIETFSVDLNGVDKNIAKGDVYAEISLVFRPVGST